VARLSLTFLRFSFLVVLALALFLMGGRPAPVHAAPFTVTRTDDPTPNGCNMNDCSLREAIIAANGVGGPLITLPAGTYTLSIPSTGEDAAADGDLDITDNVTITGAGAATTIIDGNSGVTGDKVFEVDPTSAGGIILEMSGVTVENGREAIGGGILNYGSLILTDSIVTGNVAEGVGGGLFNETGAGMSLTNVTVTGNGAAAWGGGIWSDGGLSISDSTISGNTANSTGGGVYNQSNGILAVIGSTVSANVATTTSGGGIYNTGTMGVIDSLVIGNSAASGSGGGIENDGLGVATVSNSTITGNNALSGSSSTPSSPATPPAATVSLL
jgi:CSLREA domain-containing protein